MYMVFVASALLLFCLNMYVGIQCLGERPGFDFFRRVPVALAVFAVTLVVSLFATVPLISSGVGGTIIGMFALAGLMMGPALIGASSFGGALGNILTGGLSGVLGLRSQPSFDKAQAAERRQDFVMAEQQYLDYFEANRRRNIDEADMAEARLAYGNLLQRLGRMPEAAEQWERAAAGNLIAERAQVAALRAADFFRQTGDPARADATLRAAIARHPGDPVTQSLRQRLES